MNEAYIVGAVRTPVGLPGGGLAGAHPVDLAAHTIRALLDRTGADPGAVDEVVLGQVDAIGPGAANPARACWLAAGLPEAVPGTTVGRGAGSSQHAVHLAALAVRAGSADLVVAAGVHRAGGPGPAGGTAAPEGSRGWRARFGGREVTPLRGAETMAARWDLTREVMEEFASQSRRRALAAVEEGRFEREIAPYAGLLVDEGPGRAVTPGAMAALEPPAGGRLTAALCSPLADGAAALLVASQEAVRAHGLTPRARIRHTSSRGADPASMLSAPIPATAHALRRAGMKITDFDVVEADEPYASVVPAWLRETGADPARVNPNGGALALGHPSGAAGARLMTTLLHELERTGGRYGLQTMAEEGGQAGVIVVERV
ncbi:acetyl-CoA C-acyltransferase [Sphaerisporangium sp. TRM90804]|uniref:acetyl-CoA C-acyltransferase n=1 Tax=Sphaerisporangium sp. TRM90804 TaxID=3031113 RepID=UPI002449898D|nr:acetyl-CoA C-acyltransferase [Sphaerisporangium sp. TRM90804]MDH2425221.1 acetyl-CoA C-acyltransferase [Sphaerisporangium sp. TRM90804]